MIKTVYFDMDGVLVDLVKSCALAEGYECVRAYHDEYSHRKDYIGKTLEKYIDTVFLSAPTMYNFMGLVSVMANLKRKGYTVKILSAIHECPNVDIIAEQKREWLRMFVLPYVRVDEIIFSKGSCDKVNYGSMDSVLIDDYKKTQKQFDEKGYPFILHRNFSDTVAELRELLGDNTTLNEHGY